MIAGIRPRSKRESRHLSGDDPRLNLFAGGHARVTGDACLGLQETLLEALGLTRENVWVAYLRLLGSLIDRKDREIIEISDSAR